MKIALLVIGSEILSGHTQEQNIQVMAVNLAKYQIKINQVLIIKDQTDEILQALEFLKLKNQFIITSGGLGPTLDDLTKLSIAQFFNKKICFSQQAYEAAQKHYQRVSRELATDHAYGYLPEDFIPLENPVGFAPGFYFTDSQIHLVSLPGVPNEFKAMLEKHFPQLFKTYFPSTYQSQFIIKTKRIAEEKIFFQLCPELWENLSRFGEVASLPKIQNVDIVINLKADSAHEIKILGQKITDYVLTTPLKDYIWHLGDKSLEEVIIEKAKEKNIRFSFAESCTGGLNSHQITSIAGASEVFWGSVISYDNQVKINVLNVDPEKLKKFGAVSSEIAYEMSEGVKNLTQTHIGISTTGIAGPGGGSLQKPVGLVWIGVATSKGIQTFSYQFQGSRQMLKERFSRAALFHLLEAIESH